MKNKLFLLFALCFTQLSMSQVGINTTTPDPSAMLEVSSNDKGILIPRLTTANRIAMADVQGMLVYDATLNQFFYNDGTQWISFLTAASTTQAGTVGLGSTTTGTGDGWGYYDVTFPIAFTTIPAITISLREATGVDNTGSDSITQIKVANATATGFTIGVHETSVTTDHNIDWIATPKS